MPADTTTPATTPRKKPTMNNPYMPVPQRPERIDRTWENRNDPTFREVLLRAGLQEARRAR